MLRRSVLVSLALLATASAARAEELLVGMIDMRTDGSRSADRFGLLESALSLEPNLGLLMGAEGLFTPLEGIYSAEAYAALRQNLAALTAGRKLLLAPGSIARDHDGAYRNTALVLHGGGVLLEYDKREDGGDHWYGLGVGRVWVPGVRRGTFSFGGHSAGLEICQDHFMGALRDRDGAKGLDLQLVVSSGMNISPAGLAIREGGHVLLDDGRSRTTTIHRLTDGVLEPIAAVREHALGPDATLRLFRIETGVRARPGRRPAPGARRPTRRTAGTGLPPAMRARGH